MTKSIFVDSFLAFIDNVGKEGKRLPERAWLFGALGPERKTMMKTKKILPLLSLLLLASCSTTSTNSSQGSGASTETKTEDIANVFAFGAATSIGLLSTLETTVQTPLVKRAVDDTLKQTILTYLPTIEATLKGEEVLTENTIVPSDRAEYMQKMTIRYKDLNLEDKQFDMYYNEYRVDDGDDFFEDEEEYRIDGILLIDGQEYKMKGEREQERGESELTFFYYVGERSYVEVSQESERGESEFEYEVVSNGRTIHEYSLERDGKEVELELLNREQKLDVEMRFVTFEKDGKTYIKAEVGRDVLYFAKDELGQFVETTL